MQCSANDTNYVDNVRYLEKEGALGEAVCQVQGLTKPKKSFSASGGRITLINIIVFKSANIAVWGLFWHPPGHNLE